MRKSMIIKQTIIVRFEVYHNSVEEKGIPIANALGIIIFKMLGSASLLAGLIILERKVV